MKGTSLRRAAFGNGSPPLGIDRYHTEFNNLRRISVDARNRLQGYARALPKWVDKTSGDCPHWYAICEKYEECELARKDGQEWHVDHIIPLQGELVSGLHVAENLVVLPAFDNLSKGNRFDPQEFEGP